MAGFYIKPLSEVQKGFVYMVGGILILLYAFNFFQQWLNIVVICGGFAMIVNGFIKVGGVKKVKELTERTKGSKEKPQD